jgi:hypothetical protein
MPHTPFVTPYHRFYLPRDRPLAPLVFPFDAWGTTMNGNQDNRWQLLIAPQGSPQGMEAFANPPVGQVSDLWAQYCWGPLVMGEIAGHARGQVRVVQSFLDQHYDQAWASLRVVSYSQGVRGWLIPLACHGASTPFPTRLTNRGLFDRDLDPVLAQLGDYLVLELGALASSDPGTVDFVGFGCGDDAAAFLPPDESTTDPLNAWIELVPA